MIQSPEPEIGMPAFVNPLSAARSIASLLHSARDMFLDAEGVARDSGLSVVENWIHQCLENLEGRLLPDLDALIKAYETQAGR